jgi:6-phosphogluconolactonase
MRYIFCLLTLFFSVSVFSQDYYLFIGTYTSGMSKGIYVYQFNAATGHFKAVSDISSKNPSYLALSPNGKYLYSVNENGGSEAGQVSAFSFDKNTGQLQFLNSRSSGGADPCYISENKTGKWLFVANYSGGSLAALRVKADGTVDSLAQLIQHEGSSVNKARQEKAHVHSVVIAPDERFLMVADLGMDQESVYKIDTNARQPLTLTTDSLVTTEPGSGPRHLTFHPTKPYAYLANELSGNVYVFNYYKGKLKQIQQISSHPDNFTGEKGSADIHVSPDGKFLYASNRGDANNLTIYAIDQVTGKLQLKGFQSTMGKHPRNFMIDPTGHFLLVANKDSDNIVVFAINPVTGLLKVTGEEINIPNPVCLKMMKKCTTCNPAAKKKHRSHHRKKH